MSGVPVRRAWVRMRSNAVPTSVLALRGEHALGLLDRDPAVQGRLELLGEDHLVPDRPLVQQPDGRDVGHALDDGDVVVAERHRVDG